MAWTKCVELQAPSCSIANYSHLSKNYPLNTTLIYGSCVKARLLDHQDQQKCKPKIMSAENLCCRYIDSLHCAGEWAGSEHIQHIYVTWQAYDQESRACDARPINMCIL